MKIAFCASAKALSHGTGIAVQLNRTKELLEREYDAHVEIITDPQELQEGKFEICHAFGIIERQTIGFVEKGRKTGAKIVLSTVFWDLSYAFAASSLLRLGISSYSDSRVEALAKLLKLRGSLSGRPEWFSRRFRQQLIDMISKCDCLLPNSKEETILLRRFTGEGALEKKVRIVYNAANPVKMMSSPEVEALPSNFVLEVASLEPHKNQHSLIQALFEDREIPIVLVGNRGNQFYFEMLSKLAKERGNVFFLDFQRQEVLASLYTKALVHVLPSLRESPGLTSLEALHYGCKIVVSDHRFCPVDTYFKNVATIVNPLNRKSIRSGVLSEADNKREQDLRQVHTEVFSWETAAKQTFEAYMSIS